MLLTGDDFAVTGGGRTGAFAAAGTVYDQPSDRGLTGSDADNNPDADEVVTATEGNGFIVNDDPNMPPTFDVADVRGTTPTAPNGNPTSATVNEFAGSFPSNDATVYVGQEDFAFYTILDSGTLSGYILLGTPTEAFGNNRFSNGPQEVVRTFSIEPDVPTFENGDFASRGVVAPYFRYDLYGSTPNLSDTGLLVLETAGANSSGGGFGVANITGVDPGAAITGGRTMQAWLDITGTGTGQRSAVFVNASAIQAAGDFNGISTVRRGSVRFDSFNSMNNFEGLLTTLEGPEGGFFFGPNATETVIGHARDNTGDNNVFIDNPSTTDGNPIATVDGTPDVGFSYGGNGVFGTTHVGILDTEVAVASLTRTSRTHEGYITGLVQSRGGPIAPVSVGAPLVGEVELEPNLTLTLDAVSGTAAADALLATNNFGFEGEFRGFSLTFGGGTAGTMIDDDRFAAVDAAGSAPTADYGPEDGPASGLPGDATDSTAYLVSGRAVPTSITHCTTCTFADWGWWGARVSTPNVPDGTSTGTSTRDEFVHLGTWVAGDIVASSALPTTGSANLSGTMIGNVIDRSTSTPSQYIAGGTMDMSYNFANRSGSTNITFDGVSASGNVFGTGASNTGPNTFDGFGSNGAFGFSVDGSFVDARAPGSTGAIQPNQVGAIGQFRMNPTISGVNRSATGTFLLGPDTGGLGLAR